MRTVGIIAEYNPFHNGHMEQIRMIRARFRDARIVAVMSGGFTQRGDVAILTKWERAAAAVRGGIDLVAELSFVYAVRSAQHFAEGATRLLAALGADTLAFGAECVDTAMLRRAADIAVSESARQRLRDGLSEGLSYAAAMEAAIAGHGKIQTGLLLKPNNILATEYMKAIDRFCLPMEPLPLPRVGAEHHDEDLSGSFASASAIRMELRHSDPDFSRLASVVPKETLESLSSGNLPTLSSLFRPLVCRLLTMRTGELRKIYGVGEGLENRLLRAAGEAADMESLTGLVKSRRYPLARVRRALIAILSGLDDDFTNEADKTAPPYARVLAFGEAGRKMLHELRGRLPLITRTGSYINERARSGGDMTFLQRSLSFDILATDLQEMSRPVPGVRGHDFTSPPRYIR